MRKKNPRKSLFFPYGKKMSKKSAVVEKWVEVAAHFILSLLCTKST